MKTLSRQAPCASMEIAMSAAWSVPVRTGANRAPLSPIVLASKHVSDGYSSYARNLLLVPEPTDDFKSMRPGCIQVRGAVPSAYPYTVMGRTASSGNGMRT